MQLDADAIRASGRATYYARLRVLEYRAGTLASVPPLQAFLANWLTVHDFGLGRRFAEFTQTQGSLAAPPGVSEQTVSGALEP